MFFSDKYAMKNNLQNKMQITFFLMTSNNIDFDHVCQVNMYRYFFIRARDMNKLFLSNKAISIAIRDFF